MFKIKKYMVYHNMVSKKFVYIFALVGIILGVAANVYALALTVNPGETYENLVICRRCNPRIVKSSGTTISSLICYGGNEIVYMDGESYGAVITDNGVQDVYGTTSSATIEGGTQNVYMYGTASSTTINGGYQNIYSGGIAINIMINTGGMSYSSGTVSDTIINGGYQYIWQGTATNTIIDSGQQYVYGTSSATTVNGSGILNILSGGSGNIVINNGIVNLSSDGYLTDYSGDGNLYVYGSNSINGMTDLGIGQLIFADTTSMTLNVQNLSSDGAVVSMAVNLEDQTSYDQLVINGTYMGNATLNLTNIGSAANQTTGSGILLVDFMDGSTVNGTFSLFGDQWDQGAYVYRLFQDEGNPDYYLRSTEELSNAYKTMLNITLLNPVIARTGMSSLNKRMGDLRDMNNTTKKQGIWIRSYYKDMTVDDLIKTDVSLFGVEAGYDWLFNYDEPIKLYVGTMAGYIQSNSIKTKNSFGSSNNGLGDATSIGLYATMINENGWFINFAARNFWTEIKNTIHTSNNDLLDFDVKRNIFTTNLEIGKDITNKTDLKLQPKVEISYMRAGKDTVPVTNGVGDLTYDSVNYLSGRVAIMYASNKERPNHFFIEPLVELAYNQEFLGKGKARYGGAEKKTSLSGGSFEVAAGLNMQLTNSLYWHALGTYEVGNKLSGWGINAGIRFDFGAPNIKLTRRASSVKK